MRTLLALLLLSMSLTITPPLFADQVTAERKAACEAYWQDEGARLLCQRDLSVSPRPGEPKPGINYPISGKLLAPDDHRGHCLEILGQARCDDMARQAKERAALQPIYSSSRETVVIEQNSPYGSEPLPPWIGAPRWQPTYVPPPQIAPAIRSFTFQDGPTFHACTTFDSRWSTTLSCP